jgi:hypothetical protein
MTFLPSLLYGELASEAASAGDRRPATGQRLVRPSLMPVGC